MELTWMGRYRELVRALVYFSNSSNKNLMGRQNIFSDISQTEYQILEYICEFENDIKIMADISRDLGVLPSIVTKCTKHLHELGYIEKYHIEGNRKSIVLLPTEAGRQQYIINKDLIRNAFSDFFSILEDASESDLKMFEKAVRSLGADWSDVADDVNRTLKKID